MPMGVKQNGLDVKGIDWVRVAHELYDTATRTALHGHPQHVHEFDFEGQELNLDPIKLHCKIPQKMKILICGGAGYIGSHLVRELKKLNQHEIVVLDNLSKGHTAAIPEGVELEKGDIRDKAFLEATFAKHKPTAVFHFSASIEVAESCSDPLAYYENNVAGTITLLQVMKTHGAKVRNDKYHGENMQDPNSRNMHPFLLTRSGNEKIQQYFIFSSTAALFGMAERVPIHPDDRTIPVNPYGETKLAVEHMLKWCDQAYGIKYVCLRYFNACGADASGEIGEDHSPESHLIPLVLQVPLGRREKIFIFGDDYDTHDGSCVRDYVHVTDLATAHIKSLEYMVKENTSNCFNLGSGKGYSVKEIIEAARRVTGHPIPAEIKPRRAGDPATLVASSEKAETVLGWKRQYQSIDDIVRTAWNFHQKHPHGF
ncbi:hypothetical protein HK104_009607 [Borealophlyctis nickersoniae]|nr:hypothetical protein HK104_009607 [Borealophlyctis nickersoniae]